MNTGPGLGTTFGSSTILHSIVGGPNHFLVAKGDLETMKFKIVSSMSYILIFHTPLFQNMWKESSVYSFISKKHNLKWTWRKLYIPEMIFGVWISTNPLFDKVSRNILVTPPTNLNIAWLVDVRRSRIRLSRRTSWLTVDSYK